MVLYVSEVANDKYDILVKPLKCYRLQHLLIVRLSIRGRMGMVCALFGDVGILIGYTTGYTMSYRTVPCICVILPIIFAIIFSSFPNTPQYYLSKGQVHV